MFSLQNLIGKSGEAIETGGINLIFGLVLSFLVIIIFQSFNSTSCSTFNNECNMLEQQCGYLNDINMINEDCLSGCLNNPMVNIVFMVLLYAVLSYLLFNLFKNLICSKMEQMNQIDCSINSCPLFGPKKSIIKNSNMNGGVNSGVNCDFMMGCPFGFGSGKNNNKHTNFIDESSLKKDMFGDMKRRGVCPSNIDVKVESNVDLNDDTNDISKLTKTILGKCLPGILPTILNKLNKKDKSQPAPTPETQPAPTPESQPAPTPEPDSSTEPLNKSHKKNDVVNDINNIIGTVKNLLKSNNFDFENLKL